MPDAMIVSAKLGVVKIYPSQDDLKAEARARMVCTARQARLAMEQTKYKAGHLLGAAQAAVDSSTNSTVKIAWEYATEWQRTDAFISSIGAQLGLTEEDIDNLFLLAMQL